MTALENGITFVMIFAPPIVGLFFLWSVGAQEVFAILACLFGLACVGAGITNWASDSFFGR